MHALCPYSETITKADEDEDKDEAFTIVPGQTVTFAMNSNMAMNRGLFRNIGGRSSLAFSSGRSHTVHRVDDRAEFFSTTGFTSLWAPIAALNTQSNVLLDQITVVRGSMGGHWA